MSQECCLIVIDTLVHDASRMIFVVTMKTCRFPTLPYVLCAGGLHKSSSVLSAGLANPSPVYHVSCDAGTVRLYYTTRQGLARFKVHIRNTSTINIKPRRCRATVTDLISYSQHHPRQLTSRSVVYSTSASHNVVRLLKAKTELFPSEPRLRQGE